MVEREWREASDMRPSRVNLALVLIAAAGLRLWGLGHGLPYSPATDEPEIVDRALAMMRTGTLSPHPFYDYPTLYMYVQLAVYRGSLSHWRVLRRVDVAQRDRPVPFYLAGRAVTALFGTATVLLVFQAGMRWGARHALLAAGLLAVMPVHVQSSHYVLTDTPMTFFVTLALVLSLAAHERGTALAFAWAGAAAGLAAATKYNGAIALLMPLLACLMTPRAKDSRLWCALAAIAACFVAFLLGAPYTLLDLPGFLNGFAQLSTHYALGPSPAESPTLTYVKHLLIYFGYPAALLACAGFVLAIVRIIKGPGRARWAVLLIVPTVHSALISKQHLVYGRYLLPMVPMLCLLAAMAVVSGVSLLRRYEIPRGPRAALIAALTAAALAHPAYASIRFDMLISRVDTTRMAYRLDPAEHPPGILDRGGNAGTAAAADVSIREHRPAAVAHATRSIRPAACSISSRPASPTDRTSQIRSSIRPGTRSTCGSSSRAASSCASSRRQTARSCRDRNFGFTR